MRQGLAVLRFARAGLSLPLPLHLSPHWRRRRFAVAAKDKDKATSSPHSPAIWTPSSSLSLSRAHYYQQHHHHQRQLLLPLLLADADMEQKLRDYAVRAVAVVNAGEAIPEPPYDSLPAVAGADPAACPLDFFRVLIAHRAAHLLGLDLPTVFAAIEAPRDELNGDLALPLPRLRPPKPTTSTSTCSNSNSNCKDDGKVDVALPAELKSNSPLERANALAAYLNANDGCAPFFEKITAAGPFVNFRFDRSIMRCMVLARIAKQGSMYGRNSSGSGRVAAIDMSSPNIAKPFHAGHLRSTIIGNFMRNALQANGWRTVAINYLGDWGKQYGMLGVGYAKYGDPEKLAADPIRHLFDVYVKINADAEADPTTHDLARAHFAKMEAGDEAAIATWQQFRDLSILRLDDTYKKLGIDFDVYSGESQVKNIETEVMPMLKATGLVEESDGALVVDLSADALGKALLVKRDGTKLYLTRDIGAAIQRHKEYRFDRMFYVVAVPQELHFRQLFKLLAYLGLPWAARCAHIPFGMVNEMSTRRGNVIFLDDILEQSKDKMLEVMRRNQAKFEQLSDPDAVAQVVGTSAVFVQDLSARRIRDYSFNWSRILSFEGDTGPYLQYAHARMCSIERAAIAAGATSTSSSLQKRDDVSVEQVSKLFAQQDLNGKQPGNLLLDSTAAYVGTDVAGVFAKYEGGNAASSAQAAIDRLIMQLARYPDIIRAIPQNDSFEPCNLVTYLFQLCHAVSSLYEQVRAMDADPEIRRACVLLYHCARVTLGNGLRIIGLPALTQM